MRWGRRTDDARRMKGDPPPTYQQLLDGRQVMQAAVNRAEEMALNLRHQCDGLIRENDGLRAHNRALREANLRLLNDANQMRQRLPQLTAHEGDYPHVQNMAYMPVVDDEDVTHPHVRPGQVDIADLRIPDLTEDERAAFVEPWEEER